MEALKELYKTANHELAAANDKIRAAGGKLTQSDVTYLDQLTHMMKSLKTTMAMMEGGSHRGSYDRGYDNSNYQGGAYNESNRYVSPEYHESREGSYRDSYDEGSYARRRDSMGRYM